jgi:glutamate--cysteine ligase
MADWETHLTTIFTEARLKTYIEIRSIDCLKRELGLSAAALIKGLFYDERALAGSETLTKDIDAGERTRLVKEAPKKGLYAAFQNGTLWDLAAELVRLAGDGLSSEDKPYLKPLEKLILQDKKMPAEILLDCFSGASTEEEKVVAILRCAAL